MITRFRVCLRRLCALFDFAPRRRRQLAGSLCKGTPSPHSVLRPLVGAWFQGLFHSSVRGAFHLSSRYSFAIGLSVVFSLSGWSPIIQPGFLVPPPTQVARLVLSRVFVYGAFTSSGRAFQRVPLTLTRRGAYPITPHMPCDTAGLGPPRSLAATGESLLLSPSAVLRCFSSHRSPPALRDAGIAPRRVAPFGHPRISLGICPPRGFSQNLSRPSSPPRAKASPCALRSFRFNGMPDDILLARAKPAPPKPFAYRHPCGRRRSLFLVEFLRLSSRFAIAHAAQSLSLPSCQCALFKVENNGVELLTLCLQSRCSSQLS